MAKLDVKKIKELLTARLEILGLVVAGVFVVICVVMGFATLLDASSPEDRINSDAARVARERDNAPRPPAKTSTDDGTKEWEWEKVKPKEVLMVLTAQFEAGAAGSNLRVNPKILAIDNDPAGKSFQVDYYRHGIHTYEVSTQGDKLEVFLPDKKDPVVAVAAKRLVVVTGSFPYHKQVEEYAAALRLDRASDVFSKHLAPVFEGLNVERCKITKKGDEEVAGEWVRLYYCDPDKENAVVEVHPKIRETLTTSLYDVSQVQKYHAVMYGSSVTPLPLFTHKFPYNDVKLPALANLQPTAKTGNDPSAAKDITGRYITTTVTASSPYGKSRSAIVPMASNATRGIEPLDFAKLQDAALQDQVSGNINVFSPYGTFPEDPSKALLDDDGKPKKPLPTPTPTPAPATPDPNTPLVPKLSYKAPTSLPDNPHAMIRFIDVDMEPGATYRYRVKARFANPNYGQPGGVVAHSGLASMKELVSQTWAETPSIHIPPDDTQFYITHNDKASALVSKLQSNVPKAIDRQLNSAIGDKMVPVQVQRFVGSFRLPFGKSTETNYVADWVVAERLLVARGEPIGRDCEVEMVVWNKYQSQWHVSGMPIPPDPKNPKRPTGLQYSFRPEPPVVLLDFAGGNRKYERAGFEDAEESAVEALLLMPDMTMKLRNGQDDANDAITADRRKVYAHWRDQLETLSTTPAPAAADKK